MFMKKRRVAKQLIAMCMAVSLAVGGLAVAPVQTVYAKDIEMDDMSEGAKAPEVKKKSETGKKAEEGIPAKKMFSKGLSICGTALVKIAYATGDDDFKKIANGINKMVCGGNNMAQTLTEIKVLCNEILKEVNLVDQHLKDYNSKIENSLAQNVYQSAQANMVERWNQDVTAYENENNVGNALKAYMAYMEMAQNYMDGEATLAQVQECEDDLYEQFLNVYTSKGHGFGIMTEEEIKDTIFSDETIDNAFSVAIRSMINSLSNKANYIDAAGRFAYVSLPFSCDQYEYVKASIERQFLEIITLEMMYEEFMAQRGDYFEEKYPDDQNYWDSYARWKKSLKNLNDDVAKAMDARMDQKIVLNDTIGNQISMSLDEFVKSADQTVVTMKNEEFRENFTDYKQLLDPNNDYESFDHVLKDFKSNNQVTSTYMKYQRVAVPVQGTSGEQAGIDIYYIFAPAQDGSDPWTVAETNKVPDYLRLQRMDVKIHHTASTISNDYAPSCDYLNLTRSNYSDGINTFSSVQNGAEMHSLFSTNVFMGLSSTPSTYLQDYLYSENGIKTYMLLPSFSYDFHGMAASYEKFNVIDMSAHHPGSDLEVISLQGNTLPDNYAYTTIMKNNSTEYNTKVGTVHVGTGNAAFNLCVEDAGGIWTVRDDLTVPAGQNVRLRIKALDQDCVIEKLTFRRYNDASNPGLATGEETLLTKDQFDSLETDAQGYMYFDYPAPYSNGDFILYTNTGHKISIKNDTPEYEGKVTLDAYENLFAEGETVTFFVSDNIQKIGYGEGDDYTEIPLNEMLEGERTGSFVMPDKDVTLHYEAHCDHTYDNGFCTKCGAYQPAHYNQQTGNYEIGNAGQMFWFACLINGDPEHTGITEKKVDAKGILTGDISLEDREWKPMEGFKGIFDGQKHKISGFKITTIDGDEGFFKSIESATIKNFTLVGVIGEKEVKDSYRNEYSVGGVAATMAGGLIKGVHSYVNICCGKITHLGGVVGYITAPSDIQECAYYGMLHIDGVVNGAAGIAGALEYDNKVAQGQVTSIKNCANYGEINFYTVQGGSGVISISGGLIGMHRLADAGVVLSDSFNYGNIQTGHGETGGLLGQANYGWTDKDKAENCYYLDTATYSAGISDETGEVEPRTAQQFASGEVAYLLNHGVTDGTQVWYQNIDNGKEPDIYPVLDDTHGTVYMVSDDEYTNEDKVNTYEITTFKELKQAIETAQKEPKANFKLMNNICGNGETLTEIFGSVNNPYLGTFDGQGYYIYKFNIDCGDGDAALFGAIGETGVVQKLGIFYDKTSGKRAAGIAAINAGTINECISGSNVGGTFSEQNTNIRYSLSELNTYATGTEMAGGIAVENYGVIRNTASYTKVTATNVDGIAGGIAALNSGVIENCFARRDIQAGPDKEEDGTAVMANASVAGGIVGVNERTGKIRIVYSAANSIKGNTTGTVYGVNNGGTMTDIFYLDELGIDTDQGTAMNRTEMQKTILPDKLNELAAAEENLNSWYVDSNKNSGFPMITSSMFTRQSLKNEQRGVTVTGMMHVDSKLKVDALDNTNSMYQAFRKYAEEKGMKLQFAGTPSLQYANGDAADYDGLLKLSVDAKKYAGKGYKLLVYRDGKVDEVTLDTDQLSSLDVEELPVFAVISSEDAQAGKDPASDPKNPAGNDGKDTGAKNTASVKTADTNAVMGWSLVLLLAAVCAGGCMGYRRKRGRQ